METPPAFSIGSHISGVSGVPTISLIKKANQNNCEKSELKLSTDQRINSILQNVYYSGIHLPTTFLNFFFYIFLHFFFLHFLYNAASLYIIKY